MPVPDHLAAVHFRVQLAGQSIEHAISLLKSRRVFQGRMHVQQAVGDLQHAASYLKASGQYPALLSYTEALIAFYTGEAARVVRPANAPAVGDALYSAQGNLLQADPVLFPSVAH
ncbi:MAG: hypothetical protein IVW52_05195 [Acidimicrobiales bacterium]|nr:hypothetical protein [Acidimicrobiales bacterium]